MTSTRPSARTTAMLAASLLIAGTMPVAGQDEASTPAEAFAPVACEDLGINEAVAAISDCGYVTVPENRAAGTDSSIQLGVVRMASSSDDPAAPLFVGTGGPGEPGLGFLIEGALMAGIDMTSIFAPILADHDVVWFAQRGTQGAIPTLACPEYEIVDYDAAANGWTADEKADAIRTRLQTCFDGYVEQGVDFSGYNSVENAADIVDIKDALGYDTINYYGESYGTLLGQFLMRDHEDALEAVILDGIAPATNTTYSQLFDVPGAFDRLFEACAADATCAAAFPDLEADMQEVANRFGDEPVPFVGPAADGSEVDVLIDQRVVVDAIFGQLAGGGAAAPYLIELLRNDPDSLLPQIAPTPGGSRTARGMHFAVNCSDDPNSSLEQFQLEDVPDWLRGFVRDDAERLVIACDLLGLPQLPDSSDALIESELPVLLVNGALDPLTAASNGQIVEEGLPNSQYVLFPAGGHVQRNDPCTVSIVAGFLADPSMPVDTSCIQPAPVFEVPGAEEAS